MNTHLLKICFSIVIAVTLLGYSSSPPLSGSGGHTGAPGDNVCAACHSGGTMDGSVRITGIPDTLQLDETYPITVSVLNPDQTAARGGFQIVALKGQSLTNAGNWEVPQEETSISIKTKFGKKYPGHNPAKSFGSDTLVTYSLIWSPTEDLMGEEIDFYVGSILANGQNGNRGDKFVRSKVSAIVDQTTSTVYSKTSELYVYPNPASSYLTIEGHDKSQSTHLVDMNGKRIQVSMSNNTIDVSHLPRGLYILENGPSKRKIILR